MAKLSIIQTNFTAGEISPLLFGRVDIARYQNGCKKLENGLIAVQGGVMRTWGTEFINTTKYADSITRLIPYIFNRTQAYIIEFGDEYCRVYKNTGEYLAEIESPYTEDMLFNINYVQGADTMFLAHPNKAIHRLRRVSDTEWTLSAAPFITEPFDEMGEYPAVTITISTDNTTVTASAAYWLAADVGRTINYGTGIAEITSITSTTIAKIKIITPFSVSSLPSGEWHLDNSPLAKITPSITSTTDPIAVGDTVTLTLAIAGFRSINLYLR